MGHYRKRIRGRVELLSCVTVDVKTENFLTWYRLYTRASHSVQYEEEAVEDVLNVR